MSAIEDFCRKLERLVTIHGEPENTVETGYDFKAIKNLLNELRVDFKDAKEAVIQEDKERALFSLEQSKGESTQPLLVMQVKT